MRSALVLVSLLLASTACGWKESASAQAGESAAMTPAGQGDGTPCALDVAGEKGDRVFFALGMLLEHGGRGFVEGSDALEVFFCDEKDALIRFRRVAAALAQDQHVSADLREDKEQGCVVSLRSAPLAAGLNSCYGRGSRSSKVGESVTYPGLDPGLFLRRGTVLGPDGAIAPQDLVRRRALAYVAGAWTRFRRDGAIVLTAGKAKGDLLAALLQALGCANVRVESSVGLIPGATTVRFDPTAELSVWLRKAW
jgi:hypothetical protein